MKNKPSVKIIGRSLALLLCLCLVSLPMLGMAAQTGDDKGSDADSGQEAVVIDIVPEETTTPAPEVILLTTEPPESVPPTTEPEATPETPESSEQPETPEETPTPEPPAPVCTCETKCAADAPNADCSVCAADVSGCTGQEPTPAPICACKTKCAADAPNTACPVCVADATKCQGEAPDPDFTIRILRPDGWYTDRASVVIRVKDENKTGWEKVEAKIEKNGAWTDLTDELEEQSTATLEISENCTVYVTVTDKDGKAHSKSAYIECFDREAPTLRAGIDGALLRVEASDDLSGVAYIYVNGYRFTGIVNGTLDVDLKSYADEYEQMSVVAMDYAGNKSKTVQVKNPYYGKDGKDDEDDTHNNYCPDDCDCRKTEKPATTSKPTTTSPSTTTQTSGKGGNTTTPTSTPTATPTPNKEAAEITLEPGTGFSENGNSVTRDLLYDKYTNKQFITVQDRDGNTFYIIIDYDKPIDEDANLYETYFLNLVDVAALAALAEDGVEAEPEVCSCTEKCVAGDVNMDCAVCKHNMSECAGKAAEPTPAPQETEAPPEGEAEGSPIGAIAVVLLLLAGGGAAVWYFKFRKPKDDGKGKNDLDDYGFEDDDEHEEYADDEEVLTEPEDDEDDTETEREDE